MHILLDNFFNDPLCIIVFCVLTVGQMINAKMPCVASSQYGKRGECLTHLSVINVSKLYVSQLQLCIVMGRMSLFLYLFEKNQTELGL